MKTGSRVGGKERGGRRAGPPTGCQEDDHSVSNTEIRGSQGEESMLTSADTNVGTNNNNRRQFTKSSRYCHDDRLSPLTTIPTDNRSVTPPTMESCTSGPHSSHRSDIAKDVERSNSPSIGETMKARSTNPRPRQRSKRPEMQIYVPRARRLQQEQHTQRAGSEGQVSRIIDSSAGMPKELHVSSMTTENHLDPRPSSSERRSNTGRGRAKSCRTTHMPKHRDIQRPGKDVMVEDSSAGYSTSQSSETASSTKSVTLTLDPIQHGVDRVELTKPGHKVETELSKLFGSDASTNKSVEQKQVVSTTLHTSDISDTTTLSQTSQSNILTKSDLAENISHILPVVPSSGTDTVNECLKGDYTVQRKEMVHRDAKVSSDQFDDSDQFFDAESGLSDKFESSNLQRDKRCHSETVKGGQNIQTHHHEGKSSSLESTSMESEQLNSYRVQSSGTENDTSVQTVLHTCRHDSAENRHKTFNLSDRLESKETVSFDRLITNKCKTNMPFMTDGDDRIIHITESHTAQSDLKDFNIVQSKVQEDSTATFEEDISVKRNSGNVDLINNAKTELPGCPIVSALISDNQVDSVTMGTTCTVTAEEEIITIFDQTRTCMTPDSNIVEVDALENDGKTEQHPSNEMMEDTVQQPVIYESEVTSQQLMNYQAEAMIEQSAASQIEVDNEAEQLVTNQVEADGEHSATNMIKVDSQTEHCVTSQIEAMREQSEILEFEVDSSFEQISSNLLKEPSPTNQTNVNSDDEMIAVDQVGGEEQTKTNPIGVESEDKTSPTNHSADDIVDEAGANQIGEEQSLAGPGSDAMETDEDEDDSWDKLFNDDGECLDPTIMEELTKAVGSVTVEKPQAKNYYKYQLKETEMDLDAYDHVVEIADFPADFLTRDLIAAFQPFLSRGFDIKWVDDTHALGIFSSAVAAKEALAMIHPMFTVRPLTEAGKQAKVKARRSVEFLQPYKPRPQTSASAARRLVTGALGLAPRVSREKREQERQLLREAKARKKQERRNKDDAWEGNYGKCSMDDEGS